jgi:hypothetical protein
MEQSPENLKTRNDFMPTFLTAQRIAGAGLLTKEGQ